MRRLTYKEVKENVYNLGYTLISEEYLYNDQKLILKDKEGYLYYLKYSVLTFIKKHDKFSKYNPYSIENIKLWLKLNDKPFELLSNVYENNHTKLLFKDIEGYLFTMTIANLQLRLESSYKLGRFHQSNPYTIQNIKLWCKLNNKPFKLISDIYEKDNKDLKWRCLKEGCGEIFDSSWQEIHNNNGCSFCAGMRVGLSNCLATKNPDVALEWHPTKNGNLTPWDVTCGNGKSVWWKCKECGHEWKSQINNRSNGNGISKSGCPECVKSKGEIKIRNWLKYYNVNYIPQKTFDGLLGVGGGLLSYDFYIPDYNFLIEYQGEQHEKSVDFKSKGMKYANKAFLKQQEHDKRKKDYVLLNGYKLLEIWYWDYDNIEEILTNFLKELDDSSFLIC